MSRCFRWERRRPAPVLGVGLLLLSSILLVGCGGSPPEGGDPEVEGAQALGLGPGSRLHRVILGGRGAEEHVLPQRIILGPSDAVEFITVDHRIHVVSFLADSLTADALAFLTETRKMKSPPLVSRGSRFLVSWAGAPPGRYPFLSRGHGGEAVGFIELISPGDSLTTGEG